MDRYYKRLPNARFDPVKCVARAAAAKPGKSWHVRGAALQLSDMLAAALRSLLSAKPHYVQRYARRHWELIEEGMSEEEAREMLDKQIAEAQRRIDKATSRGKDEEEFDEEDVELASMTPSERTRQFIEAVQLEEEEVLDRMAYFRALQEAEEYGEYDEYAEDGEEYEEGEEEEEEEAEGAEEGEEGEEASDEDDEKPTA